MKLYCRFMEEIVILSDGRITTCCMDPLGENAYASIAEVDFGTWREDYLRRFEAVMVDPGVMPRCATCFARIKAAPETANQYQKLFPDEETVRLGREAMAECPRRVVIELSSVCNLKCRGCMQYRENIPATRNEPLMDVDRLKDWMRGAAETVHAIRLYNYGETFVHPRAVEFVEFAKGLGMFVEIATNGQLLADAALRRRLMASGVDKLLFSIHGSDQRGAEGYMTDHFRFDLTMEILRDLVALRRELGAHTELYWKYLLFTWNDTDEDMDRAVALAREIGLDKVQFTLPGYPSPSRRFSGPPNRNVRVVNLAAERAAAPTSSSTSAAAKRPEARS
ncbi:MAG: radical SAM protein [Desulfovibrionaceae bacterium]